MRVLRCASAIGLAAWVAVSAGPGRAREANAPPSRPSLAPSILDDFGRLSVNDLDLGFTNYGAFAWRGFSGGPALLYPRSFVKSPLYAGGLWIAAKRSGTLRTAISEYSLTEYSPGPAPGGFSSADDPRFRIYTLVRNDTTSTSYQTWPSQDGAPLNLDGTPRVTGDVMAWSVANGADPLKHHEGSQALPIEVRQSAFAYAGNPGDPHTIYFIFNLRNTSTAFLDSAYVGFWLDADVGGSTDDLVGCDPSLDLGYAYNAPGTDVQYGSSPPALGMALLHGPTVGPSNTLGMTAFSAYKGGEDPSGSQKRFLLLQGRQTNGQPVHLFDNPSASITTYRYSGDPVTPSGWVDSEPSDRRFIVSAGPFSMASGDTQEIVAALIVGQGPDRLSSISDLRARTLAARSLYSSGFPTPGTSVPVLIVPVADSVTVGGTMQFDVRLLGDDPNLWTLAMDSGPAGANFQDLGGNRGRFEWTPAGDQEGAHTATFSAWRPGQDTLRMTADLIVLPVRYPPQLGPVPDFVVYLGQTAEQPFEASAPDGEPMYAYDCSETAWSGRSVTVTSNESGRIQGVIRADASSYYFYDDEFDVPSRLCVGTPWTTVIQPFTIHVRSQPQPPRVLLNRPILAQVGRLLEEEVEFYDDNQFDSLRVEVSGLPPSLGTVQQRFLYRHNRISCRLYGVPTQVEAGDYVVIWQVSDGTGFEVQDTTMVRILPRPPEMTLPPSFLSGSVSYTIPPGTIASTHGDFNRDGIVDVAALAHGERYDALTILPGGADGTFSRPDEIILRATAIATASGDWDLDGVTDLAVAFDSSGVIELFHGRGNGTFDTSDLNTGASLATALAMGDVDADGHPDIVSGTGFPRGAALFLGAGDGTFAAPVNLTAPSAPTDLAIADYNGDGTPDLALACMGSNSVTVALGPLLPSPASTVRYDTVNSPRSVVADDFTGDGLLDLAVIGHGLYSQGSVAILVGKGDGSFQAGSLILLGRAAGRGASGDFNGDGRRDLAVGFVEGRIIDLDGLYSSGMTLSEPGATILLGAGNGTFRPQADFLDDSFVTSLEALDLDADGKDDLLCTASGGALYIVRGAPEESLREQAGIEYDGPVRDLVAADLTGDGAAEIAVLGDSEIVIWRNAGQGSFDPPDHVPTPGGGDAQAMVTGDFDGDGKGDLAVMGGLPWRLAVLEGRGVGPWTFEIVETPDSLPEAGLGTFSGARAADLNGDGMDDLTVLADATSMYRSVVALVAFAGGPGGLRYRSGTVTDVEAHFSRAVALAHAGTIELVYEDSYDNQIEIDRWDPDFQPTGSWALPGTDVLLGAAAGDFDGDGTIDLATTGRNLLVIPRDASGNPGTPQVILAGRYLPSLLALDFDGDAIADLAALDQVPNAIAILSHAGGPGELSAAPGYGLPSTAVRVAAADLNGDGAIDLLASCQRAERIVLLLNQTAAAPVAILDRVEVGGDRVSLIWRTVAPGGSRGMVMRSGAGGDISDTVTVGMDGRVVFEDEHIEPGASYEYRLRVLRAGSYSWSAPTPVEVPAASAPVVAFALAAPSPNPVGREATIRWALPSTGHVVIRVHDVQGRCVATLFDGVSTQGNHELRWTGNGTNGHRLASGVYWIRLSAPEGVRSRRVVFLR